MKCYLTPYKLGSESAKELSRNLGLLRTLGNKRFLRPTTLINWGNTSLSPRGRVHTIFNKPEAVARATNKLEALRLFTAHGVPTVNWTTSYREAATWIDEENFVYGRQYLEASQGKGIHIITADSNQVPFCPLYTKALPKAHEYRVHVAFGEIIDFTKKKRRNDVEASPYIKNYENGWVFCREEVFLPQQVREASLKAVSVLGLDFGALDVLYKERDNKVAVLEINTAPGLEGTSLQKYTEAFQNKLRRMYVY